MTWKKSTYCYADGERKVQSDWKKKTEFKKPAKHPAKIHLKHFKVLPYKHQHNEEKQCVKEKSPLQRECVFRGMLYLVRKCCQSDENTRISEEHMEAG